MLNLTSIPSLSPLLAFQVGANQLNTFEQFLTRSVTGIQGTGVISGMLDVCYTILLIGFLWELYGAVMNGGDVKGLGKSLAKYIATAIVVQAWPEVFIALNHGFVASGTWITTKGGVGNVLDTWGTQMLAEYKDGGVKTMWAAITGGYAGAIEAIVLVVSYTLYPIVTVIFGFLYMMMGSILFVTGPLVISLLPFGAANRIAKSYIENLFIWNAWPLLYGALGLLITAVHAGDVQATLGASNFLGAFNGLESTILAGLASMIYSIGIAVIPWMAKSIVTGDVGSAAGQLLGAAATALSAGIAAGAGIEAGMAAGGAGGGGGNNPTPVSGQQSAPGSSNPAGSNQPAMAQPAAAAESGSSSQAGSGGGGGNSPAASNPAGSGSSGGSEIPATAASGGAEGSSSSSGGAGKSAGGGAEGAGATSGDAGPAGGGPSTSATATNAEKAAEAQKEQMGEDQAILQGMQENKKEGATPPAAKGGADESGASSDENNNPATSPATGSPSTSRSAAENGGGGVQKAAPSGAQSGGGRQSTGGGGGSRGAVSRAPHSRHGLSSYGAYHGAKLATQAAMSAARGASGGVNAANKAIGDPKAAGSKVGGALGSAVGGVVSSVEKGKNAVGAVASAIAFPQDTAAKVAGSVSNAANSVRQSASDAKDGFKEGYKGGYDKKANPQEED